MFITVLIPDSYSYFAVQDSSNSLEKINQLTINLSCEIT